MCLSLLQGQPTVDQDCDQALNSKTLALVLDPLMLIVAVSEEGAGAASFNCTLDNFLGLLLVELLCCPRLLSLLPDPLFTRLNGRTQITLDYGFQLQSKSRFF